VIARLRRLVLAPLTGRITTRQAHTRQSGSPDARSDWRATLRRRAVLTAAVFAAWAVGIEARLFVLQVKEHDELVERADRQQVQTRPLAAKRGDILDRSGHVLATSLDADTIYAVPSAIGDEPATIAKLCSAFGDCTAKDRRDLLERLRKQRSFAYVRRQVSQEVAARVAALNLDGIGFVKESHREYPNNELAAHVVGFVGIDNKGLNGIESAYDSMIRGKDGQVLVQTDARRHAFNRFERPPTAGASVELTIDHFLQHIVERELHAGVVENRALGGTALIMDPHTGEILALANEPTFDPNQYRESTELARRNRGVQDLYEPGSTFKVVTASAAIEEKLMPVDTLIDTSGGQIHIGSRVVRDTHNYGTLSFTDVIVKSSNVGAIRIGMKLGTDRLSDYVQKFGFGRPASPDFPSENPGIVWERTKWTESALASVSMGYQVGVTPLQMASAVSSVANHGEYIEPRVIRALYRDGRRLVVRPRVLRRTVSTDTAAAMTGIMEQVVERGTATAAKIPGYTIAGKTGTANKLINGHYSSETFASFVGFLPSNDPRVTILVVLDSPHGNNGHFGGPVSGPIFKRIADEVVRYLGIPPSINRDPPVLVARLPDGLAVPTVVEEGPAPLQVEEEEPGTVPDVRGMSARDAMRRLAQVGLTLTMQGAGFVVAQDPPPGTPVETARVCRLTLQRAPVRQTASVKLP
jgi:cell division protein FtsI (penicillin-binding protein 3)